MNATPVRVRFPPSPTGAMHIGTARALLFNFLFARKNSGAIVFRSEDTDRQRSSVEFEKEILEGLSWLGVTFDEGPFRQSERYALYEAKFEELKKSGAIYPCFCNAAELDAEREKQTAEHRAPGYSGRCRDLTAAEIAAFEKEGRQPAWRFRVPAGEIKFVDLVRGEIAEKGEHIADFVVRKADGQFLYHFCVVADDIDMRISHVIRGEDHISNTPKHILLFQAFGASIPQFAHLPLLLNADRSKMSKRDASGRPMTLTRLREDGYLPAAVANYLALLGWNPGDAREFFTLPELAAAFTIERVQKAGAVFDLERLQFFNQHYLRQLPAEELIKQIRPLCDFEIADDARLLAAVKLITERLKFIAEAPAQLRFFFVRPAVDTALFPHEKMKVDLQIAEQSLRAALPVLDALPAENWHGEALSAPLLQLINDLGIKNGQLLWPLRVALTGEKFSPGTFEVAEVLGKAESLARLRAALDTLSFEV